MRLNLITVFLILSCTILSAQNLTIKGKVVDGDKEPMIGATCIVINPKDSIMLSFGITNTNGQFELNNVPASAVKLQITYIGYGTFERPYDFSKEVKVVDLGDIQIAQSSQQLGEVQIEASFIPIVIKKDTVEYTADAFRVTPNANVEELLKKLPGVEVDAEGNITAQGETVNKVTVDGKKFFGNDPKVATRNLQAAAIKKVQVIDEKSERAQFSGIEDGVTTKTINLELKDNSKVGVFGEVYAGVGTDNRYDTKAMVNKFSGKYQASSLVTFNNINQQGFSFSDYASLMGDAAFNSRDTRGPVNFGGRGNGDTKSLTGGLNFNYDFTKRINWTTSYFLSYVDKTQLELNSRENFLGNRNFFVNEDNTSDSYSLGHDISTRFDARPDSVQRINVELNYKNTNTDRLNDALSETLNNLQALENRVKNNENGSGNNTNISLDLEYSLRLGKPGRLFSLNTNLGNTKVDNETFFDQERSVFDRNNNVSIDSILQRQLSVNDNNNIRIRTSYTEPLGKKNYLELSYTRRNYNTNRLKDFYDIDPAITTIETLNRTLSTLVDNSVNYDRMAAAWTKNGTMANVVTELTFQHSTISGQAQEILQARRSFDYLLPSFTLNFNKTRLRLRYTTDISEPSATQLQPVVDNSNPLNIYQGNPGLKPEYNHDINARYSFFDVFNLRSFFAFASYRITTDNIVNATTIDESFIRTTTPLNLGNQSRANMSLNYGTPIRPLKLKTRIGLSGNWSKSLNFVNNAENTVNTYGPSTNIEFENTNNEKVTVTTSARYNYSYNQYSADQTLSGGFLNQTYVFGTIINLGKGFTLDANMDYNVYSKERFGDNNTIALLNAALSKNVMKNRLIFKVSGFDLLNQNIGLSRTAGTTYIEQSLTNSIQRYGMVKAIYKLSSFNPNEGRGGPRFMRG